MQTELAPISDTHPILAVFKGQQLTAIPRDLYIPPEALEVILETFEGPLDLLLYLIKKNNLDILDVPIAAITRQYMTYVELMHTLQLELAAEYLVMAAMLAEIKSRMLLPRQPAENEDEADPRAELIRRLQEYERFKQIATELDAMPRIDRDIYIAEAAEPEMEVVKAQPDIDLKDLLFAFKEVYERAELNIHHQLRAEVLSIRERMAQVIEKVRADKFTEFKDLFDVAEGRMGVVVTFIAILELIRQAVLELVQAAPFAPIHVKAV
jgi:segregation and condensation protein A